MAESAIQRLGRIFTVDADGMKPEVKPPRRISIIRNFGLNTSTHGIPGIARSQSPQNRIFWTVSLVIYTGIMLYFVSQTIKTYFQYPTQTQVTIVEEWPQAFPAITICNYSPLRFDRFIGPFLDYTSKYNITGNNGTKTFSPLQATYIRDFFQYKLNRYESVEDAFYPLSSMLVRCVYNGMNCSSDDFVPFLSSYYGQCYTFNAKAHHIRNGSLFSVTDNGQAGILKLQLYSHGHQYVPFLSDGVGFIAMIHENQELPLIHRSGFYLTAGRKHLLSYTKKKQYLLGAPYVRCTDVIPTMLKAAYNRISKADYVYMEYICYDICCQVYTYVSSPW